MLLLILLILLGDPIGFGNGLCVTEALAPYLRALFKRYVQALLVPPQP